MDYFFLVSYHGSTYDKLEKSLNSHEKIQKVLDPINSKKIYLNCSDVENSKSKHKNIFGGSWHFDTILENYEIASVDVLKNYFLIYYFENENKHNDNMYLNYRLRRMYEMMHKSNDFVVFFNEENNFENLLKFLEKKLNLDSDIKESKQYSSKLMGYEKCDKDKIYYKIIKEQFADKILI
jgi:membrane-bound acyltransferase YfiQ involved in biofilm formation